MIFDCGVQEEAEEAEEVEEAEEAEGMGGKRQVANCCEAATCDPRVIQSF